MESYGEKIIFPNTPLVDVYINRDNKVQVLDYDSIPSIAQQHEIFWIDIINPKEEQLLFLGSFFNIEFSLLKERNEIEHSSRYWEEDGLIQINSNFFTSFFFAQARHEPYAETVSFFVNKGMLLTIRYKELKTFDEVKKRILGKVDDFTKTNFGTLGLIFEVRTDRDADNMEYIEKEVHNLRHDIIAAKGPLTEGYLEKIDSYQQFISQEKITIQDRRKALTSLLKSSEIPQRLKEDLEVMLKDIASIVEFGNSNLNALDNIQNLLMSKIGIEQNVVIKIFTIVNVIFLPPTLIASIFGMNFKNMPELDTLYGYPFSLIFMLVSALTPIWFFKKKGWM